MTEIWAWLTRDIPYSRLQILAWWMINVAVGFYWGRHK